MRKRFLVLFFCLSITGCSMKPSVLKDKVMAGAESVADQILERHENAAIVTNLVFYGNPNLWEIMAQEGVPLNGYAQSTFRYALDSNRYDFAYYIIDHGVDLGYQDADGKTELMYLAEDGYHHSTEKLVTKLVANGCDPEQTDHQNRSAIEEIISASESYNSLETARKLELYHENGVPIREETVKEVCENHFSSYTALNYLSSAVRTELPDYTPETCLEAAFLRDMDYLKKHINEWKNQEELYVPVLFYVAALGDQASLEYFLDETHRPPELEDGHGTTLLMAAAFAGNYENFAYLYDKVPHGTINDKEETLLVAAICGGNPDILDRVKEEPKTVFDYESVRDMDWTVARGMWDQLEDSLAVRGEPEIIRWCLDTYEWDADEADRLCDGILRVSDTKCLEEILNHNKIMDFIKSDESFAEWLLVTCSSSEQVRLILSKVPDSLKGNLGASLSRILERQGITIIEDSAAIVRAYVQAGVPLNHGGKAFIPLLSATEVGDIAAIQELVRCGSDINQLGGSEGRSALHTTTIGDYITMEALLKLGADPDVLDPNGQTPLIWAVRSDSKECVSMLLKYGADPTIKSADGKTAYDWAIEEGKEEIALLLEAN